MLLLLKLFFLRPSKVATSGGGSRNVPDLTVVINIGRSIFDDVSVEFSSFLMIFGRRSRSLELTLLKNSFEGEYNVLFESVMRCEGGCSLLVMELYSIPKSSFGTMQF